MIGAVIISKWFQAIILILLIFILSIGCFFNFNFKKHLQYFVFDSFNSFHPRLPTDDIIIVDIDEETLNRMGQWPLPRNIMADMVLKMKVAGVKATVFDMVFAEPDRSSPHLLVDKILKDNNVSLENYDAMFASAIKQAGNVVTGFIVAKPEETRRSPHSASPIKIKPSDKQDILKNTFKLSGAATNLPELSSVAAGNGIFLATPSSDGLIRDIPLLVNYNDTLYPTLALEGLRVGHDRREFLKVAKITSDEFSTEYTLKIGESPYSIPIESDAKFIIKYRKMDKDKDYLSLYKLFDPTYAKEVSEKLEGRIAFVGTSAEGLKDIRSTPLSVFVPGVEIHANIVEQIIQKDFIYRYERIAHSIEAFVIIFVGVLLVILSLYTGIIVTTLVTIGTILAGFYGALYAYVQHGLLFDPLYPSLCLIIIFIISTIMNFIRTENKAREIRSAFGMYLSPDVLSELTEKPDTLKLGGEIRELTVMFTDIRNFTTISENMTPEQLINTMNDFLTPMSDVVMQNRGTIDKYMGDAMMAFWNAPLDDNHHARHALKAALKMRSVLEPVNKNLIELAKSQGREAVTLAAGIGVNTGLCSVGNMGSKQRFAYSALGDAVNLASRLESQTKAYGLSLLIGEETARQTRDFAIIEIDKIKVKGKTQAVRIFTVLGDETLGAKTSFRKFRVQHKLFLRDYRRTDFENAALRIQKLLLDHHAQDLKSYYKMMLDRMAEYQSAMPQKPWDGVFIADSK